MIQKKLVMSAVAGVILAVTGSAHANPSAGNPSSCAPDCVRQNPVKIKPVKIKPIKVAAPEIDVRAGGGAIALLITAMLLAAERTRRS